jgi:hypothetical protein
MLNTDTSSRNAHQFMTVTIPHLRRQGALFFAWIPPGNHIGGRSSGVFGEPSYFSTALAYIDICPHNFVYTHSPTRSCTQWLLVFIFSLGGFAYLFGELDQPSEHDCFFALDVSVGAAATLTPHLDFEEKANSPKTVASRDATPKHALSTIESAVLKAGGDDTDNKVDAERGSPTCDATTIQAVEPGATNGPQRNPGVGVYLLEQQHQRQLELQLQENEKNTAEANKPTTLVPMERRLDTIDATLERLSDAQRRLETKLGDKQRDLDRKLTQVLDVLQALARRGDAQGDQPVPV